MMKGTDYYQSLGLNRDASPDEIRRAYHRNARRLHPDVNVEAGATELFLYIQEAYEILSDPKQREKYDSTLPPLPSQNEPVDVSTIYSRPSLIKWNEQQLLYVLIDIVIPKNAFIGPSLPLNISLVIDRSTSMQGERMDMVKSTAIELIRQLRPDDLLSIVSFSDRADVLVSASQRMTRTAIEDRIRQINTGGGTEIFQGLEAGFMQVRNKARGNFVNHIVLITDGRTYGDEAQCIELADQAAATGIAISSLGIGDEWNDEFLDDITSRTGSSSVYVAESEDIKNSLWQKFDGLGRIYADRVTLDVIFNPGVDLTYAFRLSPEASPISTLSPIQLGNIPLGQNLTFILELKVKPLYSGTEDYTLVEGKISMGLAGSSRSGQNLRVKLTRPVSDKPVVQPPPTRLLQAMSQLNLYRMQENAHKKLKAGDVDSATRHLQNLATRLFAQGKSDLARSVLNEIDQIHQNQNVSEESKKHVKYATRALLLPGSSSDSVL